MKFIKNLPIEKIYNEGLSLDEGMILYSVLMYTLNGNTCKASYEYFGIKVLNKTERTAKRIIKKLIEEGYLYRKSGKYTNKVKQEANEYTLSPKCNKIFSRDKTSLLSRDKTSHNIKNKENEANAGFIPASLQGKYHEYVKNFGKERAIVMIQKIAKNPEYINK